jgi:hypothetical protein
MYNDKRSIPAAFHGLRQHKTEKQKQRIEEAARLTSETVWGLATETSQARASEPLQQLGRLRSSDPGWSPQGVQRATAPVQLGLAHEEARGGDVPRSRDVHGASENFRVTTERFCQPVIGHIRG